MTNKIRYLREILRRDAKGNDGIAMEVAYDNGPGRVARFFAVPTDDLPEARALYAAWGGSRPEGYRVGTAAEGPRVASHPWRPLSDDPQGHRGALRRSTRR